MPARQVEIAGAALGRRNARHLDSLEGLFAAMLLGLNQEMTRSSST